MAANNEWSLEKYATPDNPYGMSFDRYGNTKPGKDEATGVTTSVWTIVTMHQLLCTRQDIDSRGRQRLIKKRFGLQPWEHVGNPSPYDDIMISGREGWDLRFHLNTYLTNWDKSKADREFYEGKEPTPVVPYLTTAFEATRRVHEREYRFNVVYFSSRADTEELSPIREVEFSILPTVMVVDGFTFPIENSGELNYMEVDNYITQRGIQRNLDEVKSLLEDPTQTQGVLGDDPSFRVALTLDGIEDLIYHSASGLERGFEERARSASGVQNAQKRANREVNRAMRETAKVLQTVQGTNLTAEELQIVGQWAGVGIVSPDNNLHYDISNPDSILAAANRYIATVVSSHHRRIAEVDKVSVIFRQVDPDNQWWEVYSKKEVRSKDELWKVEGKEEKIDEGGMGLSTPYKNVIYSLEDGKTLEDTDYLGRDLGSRLENLPGRIFGFEEKLMEDGLLLIVRGLRHPFREALFGVPSHVNNLQLQAIIFNPPTDGWQNIFPTFPRMTNLVIK